MSTKGYIQYNSDSPIFMQSLSLNSVIYESPIKAIEANYSIDEVLYALVAQNKKFYNQYVGYILQGPNSSILNKAIKDLLVPRIENEDWPYIYVLNTIPSVPEEYTVLIIRSLYTYEHIANNVYRKDVSLNSTEIYKMILIQGIPLYIGIQGAFLLLKTSDQDITNVLEALEIS